MASVSVLIYMYKLVGFDVWRVGAKGAGVYCFVKVLFVLKVTLACKSFYCGERVLSEYHVSLVDMVGKCLNNDGSHCISLAILCHLRQ
jgi:hypothetical protein